MKRLVIAAAVIAIARVAGAQGSAGSGSATGSGSGSGPKMLQLPQDVSAPEVSAAASPSTIKLGSRFTLFVTAVYGDGVEVNLREPFELGRAFEVKRRVSQDHLRSDGRHTREYQLEVFAWELGDLQIPPVTVTFTVGGRAGQVETAPVPVRVIGVLGDTDDPKLMRDSAPPIVLRSRDWFWAWVGGAAGAVVGAGIAIAWIRRKRRRIVVTLVAGATAAPRRIDMTSQRALERLLAIEKSGVLDHDDDRKRGYAEMADVIRDYLGARYGVVTYDLTTAELMRALARVAPDGERALVETWLERCDLVKYGGFRATRLDAGDVLADARTLVIATSSAHAATVGEAA